MRKNPVVGLYNSGCTANFAVDDCGIAQLVYEQIARLLLLRKSRSYAAVWNSRADDSYSRGGNYGGSLVHGMF